MKKTRGRLLTSILIIESVLTVFYLYLLNMPAFFLELNKTYTNIPSWTISISLLSILVDTVSLLGIWAWKKMAVYVYISTTILSILAEAFILKPNFSSMGGIFFSLTLTGLFFYAIGRKWKFFS